MPAVGLELARAAADPVRVCRWTNLLGEIEYFSGNVDTAAALVGQALTGLQRCFRSRTGTRRCWLALLQNDALVSEATGDWQTALERQQRALEIRREAEDARGAAQSLHGIGKAYCGLGRPGDAEQALEEAAQAADRPRRAPAAGEDHPRAGRRPDHPAAAGRRGAAHRAGAGRVPSATAPPTTWPPRSSPSPASPTERGHRAEAVTHADQARSAIEPGGYRVLYRLFPHQDVPPAARIRAGTAGVRGRGRARGALGGLPARRDRPRIR